MTTPTHDRNGYCNAHGRKDADTGGCPLCGVAPSSAPASAPAPVARSSREERFKRASRGENGPSASERAPARTGRPERRERPSPVVVDDQSGDDLGADAD